MIRIIFLAITLLLCGVATADPRSSSHALVDHQELATPMFCVASYALFFRTIEMDPSISSTYKMEIRSRGAGLADSLDSYLSDNGHGDDPEVELVFNTMMENVYNLMEQDISRWLELVKESDCKGMTE